MTAPNKTKPCASASSWSNHHHARTLHQAHLRHAPGGGAQRTTGGSGGGRRNCAAAESPSDHRHKTLARASGRDIQRGLAGGW